MASAMNVQYTQVSQYFQSVEQSTSYSQRGGSSSNSAEHAQSPRSRAEQQERSSSAEASVVRISRYSEAQSFSMFEHKLASSSSLRAAVDTTGAKIEPTTQDRPNSAEAVANSILDFIGQRLESDKAAGATEEELQERLEAGLKGFKQGFGEAKQMLEDLDLLSQGVATDIGETYDRVIDGVEDLRKEFSPSLVAQDENKAAPSLKESIVDKTLNSKLDETASDKHSDSVISSRPEQAEAIAPRRSVSGPSQAAYQSLDYERGRSFQFELTTNDGDTISIDAASLVRYAESQSASQGPRGSYAALSFEAAQESQFDLQISGDIDAGEWQAFTELFDQVRNLAEDFYQGDIGSAFEKALSIGYDSSEIAEFSLNLQQSTSVRQVAAYEALQPASPWEPSSPASSLAPLQDYAQQLLDSLDKQQAFGLQSGFVQDLFAASSDGTQPEHDGFMADLFKQLEPSAV